jgi:hypothetical protein
MFAVTQTSYDSSDETQYAVSFYYETEEEANKGCCFVILDHFHLELVDSNEDVDYPWQIEFAKHLKKGEYVEAINTWCDWRSSGDYSVYDDGTFEVSIEEVAVSKPKKFPELKIG